MNQDNQPQPRREFDLDHVNLHSDVSVDRFHVDEDPPAPITAKKPRGRTRELFFSTFLNMVLAAGFGYLMWERQNNQVIVKGEMSKVKSQLEISQQKLDQANLQIQELEGHNKKLKNKGENLSQQEKELSSSISKEREQAQLFQKELTALKKEKTELDKELNSQKSRYDALKTTAAKKETELTQKISSLESVMVEKETDFQNQLAEMKKLVQTLNSERTTLTRDLNQYREQIQEEARAGQAAMREQGVLANENKALVAQISKLGADNKSLKAQIKELKEVTTGELVPFSSEITLPVPHYKEPLPKGLKWPKGSDFVVVHMLINESGGVNEIYYPQGQFVDAQFQSMMSPVLFKWKFSPPRFESLNVKTWVPIIIREP